MRILRAACCVGYVLVLAYALDAAWAAEPPANSFTVRADWFDRGNVHANRPGEGYAKTYPCIWNAGPVPNRAEYDIEFPVTAEYKFVALYTAHSSRPVDIYLDDAKVHRGFAGVTGSWQTDAAKWEDQCTIRVTEGRHTIKLICPGPCMPHICAFRMESSVPFPNDWALCRQATQENTAVDSGTATDGQTYVCDYPVEPPAVYDYHQPFKRIPPPTPKAHRILEYTLMGEGRYQVEADVVARAEAHQSGPASRNELLQSRDDTVVEMTPWLARLSVEVGEGRTETETLNLSPDHLRKMLQHSLRLVEAFRATADRGGDLLQGEGEQAQKILGDVERLLTQPDDRSKWIAFYDLYLSAYQLKNRVALANPLLDFDRLLLAKRLTYNTSHIYTTYYDGSGRYKAGSGIFTLSPVRPDGSLANLTGELKTDAIYRDPDLSFDAQNVLFSYKPDRPTPCRIYEIGVDGNGLRQITDSEYDDVDPCHLPDGKILFVSTRCRRVTLCHNAFTVSVLHTMDADGSNIRCISRNTVHDFRPSVMPNGQITFTRWEYVDKHLGNQQSLWTSNPDGTRTTHVAGNHFGPLTYWEPFRVPDSRQYVCILAPHMPLAAGPVALIDPIHSSASPAIYDSITPELPPATHFSWLRKDVGYYTYAYPLSEDYFIVSYCYGPDDRDPNGYGIYLLDRWNNRDLIYRDPELACFEPIPVRTRKRPPIIPPRERDDEVDTGTFFVANVHEGLPGVAPGEVKYLRIIEEIPKPVSADCPGFAIQYPVISNRGHLAAKRLWGTVPVESDGSAHFRAPADRPIYFAALDENFMEIQRMRSFTSVSPGQQFACVGCHEPKHTSPTSVDTIAMHRLPSEITPPSNAGVHAPDFYYDVQPVLDKHCVKCHTGAKPKGGVDLSADFTSLFNVAYDTLTGRGLVKYVSDYDVTSLPTRPPKYYGSHASKVLQTLLTKHREEGRVDMPPEDLRRLVTWIDCNCPYYGTYTFSRSGTIGGRELFAPHKVALNEIYERRCQSCHASETERRLFRVCLPDFDRSRPLVAPLAKGAGGEQSCEPVVFANADDPDYRKLAAIFAKVKADTDANPRVDMLGERPPLLDPDCRYVFRP